MNYKQEYERWLNDPSIDETTKKELKDLKGNEKEIEERFYTYLAFGTGGMRGVIGAGANRMNIYTVRKATQGLANYIIAQGTQEKGAVIAYDCRRMSPEFCLEAALTLAANNIPAYIFDSLRPTPALSFAVRYLKCTAGIVITASHNPPEYNGYKCYWDDGGQAPYPRDAAILDEVNKVEISSIKTMERKAAEAANLLRIVGSEVDEAYYKAVLETRRRPEAADPELKIVYTPFHGTGNIPVRKVLEAAGYKSLFVVEEQAVPDPNFTTVPNPNPETYASFKMAEELAREKDADIILATDPDADRMGVAVKLVKDGKISYIPFTGNMTGVILAGYLLEADKEKGVQKPNDCIITTIVSTDMTRVIAADFGVSYMEVLTGFKYFGEKCKEFEQSGSHKYIFGFEESYGCLAGDYARDKDAVQAVMLLCEAASYYAKSGKTLWDVMQELYKRYGYYKEYVESITLKGLDGQSDIKRIMQGLRAEPPKELGEVKVTESRDYEARESLNKDGKHKIELPKADVVYYVLEDESWACVRPSGTEPKIKLYFGTVVKKWKEYAEGEAMADEKLETMANALRKTINEHVKI